MLIKGIYKFIGNYYSLRSNHEKAVYYFQRALRLNPHYLAAWTLMGHEYMEMKNTNAAIQCYRQAIGMFKSYMKLFLNLNIKCLFFMIVFLSLFLFPFLLSYIFFYYCFLVNFWTITQQS